MTEPSRTPAAPSARLGLSLRWKAFGVLLLLLGVVHAFFAVFAYRQALELNRRDESERLAGFRQMFEAQLQFSAQQAGRIAAQIAASTSVAELNGHPLDSSRISPDLLAETSSVRLFDASGRSLGGIADSSPAPGQAALEAQLLATARTGHRPASGLRCQDECTQFVYEPGFDRDGHEVVIGIGQPASAMLQAFSRQTGADIALLSAAAPAAAHGAIPGRLFGRAIYAVTHAPTLLPRLQAEASGAALPAIDEAFTATSNGSTFMMLLSPLSASSRSQVCALFVLDESAALRRIRSSLGNGIGASLGGLVLSAAALWWFLTPLSRRLQVISRALPMLAEQRFADARRTLDKTGKPPRWTDEIDLLAGSARWLTQRLEQLNTVEAASAAKSRFLATMSHEVRTPLNGILGLLEILQFSRLDAGQRDSVRMVHESAQSLLRVLDDTLDLARIEAGGITLEAAPFSIEDVVAGCIETVAPKARSKALKLLAHVDTGMPPQVIGDAMRLRQVLGNLCSNAVKFTDAGRVVVCAEVAGRIGSSVRVRFSVQDTGAGIPEEVQGSLFVPFEQGGGATAARYGGSGLGLSICRGLVQRMGGRIGFVSNPGAGTEFSFWLEFPVVAVSTAAAPRSLAGVKIELAVTQPDEKAWLAGYLRAAGARVQPGAALRLREEDPQHLLVEGGAAGPQRLPYPVHRASLVRAVALAAGFEEAPQQRAAPQAPDRPLRILAVDDHPTNREVIQRQLGLLGHQAATAPDAAAALEALAREPFDLLLTDLRMPGMGGIELAGEVRYREDAGSLSGRLPILALSAQPAASETERCLAAGMDGCLSKPIGLEELRLALLRWTTRPAAPQPPAASGGNRPVIDREALARLVGGDDALVEQLLGDFVAINTPLVAALPELATQADEETLAAAAHRLLGSARTVNAPYLAQALAELESAAQAGVKEEFARRAESACAEFRRVRQNLEGLSA